VQATSSSPRANSHKSKGNDSKKSKKNKPATTTTTTPSPLADSDDQPTTTTTTTTTAATTQANNMQTSLSGRKMSNGVLVLDNNAAALPPPCVALKPLGLVVYCLLLLLLLLLFNVILFFCVYFSDATLLCGVVVKDYIWMATADGNISMLTISYFFSHFAQYLQHFVFYSYDTAPCTFLKQVVIDTATPLAVLRVVGDNGKALEHALNMCSIY
jgi:hypothetical protein